MFTQEIKLLKFGGLNSDISPELGTLSDITFAQDILNLRQDDIGKLENRYGFTVGLFTRFRPRSLVTEAQLVTHPEAIKNPPFGLTEFILNLGCLNIDTFNTEDKWKYGVNDYSPSKNYVAGSFSFDTNKFIVYFNRTPITIDDITIRAVKYGDYGLQIAKTPQFDDYFAIIKQPYFGHKITTFFAPIEDVNENILITQSFFKNFFTEPQRFIENFPPFSSIYRRPYGLRFGDYFQLQNAGLTALTNQELSILHTVFKILLAPTTEFPIQNNLPNYIKYLSGFNSETCPFYFLNQFVIKITKDQLLYLNSTKYLNKLIVADWVNGDWVIEDVYSEDWFDEFGLFNIPILKEKKHRLRFHQNYRQTFDANIVELDPRVKEGEENYGGIEHGLCLYLYEFPKKTMDYVFPEEPYISDIEKFGIKTLSENNIEALRKYLSYVMRLTDGDENNPYGMTRALIECITYHTGDPLDTHKKLNLITDDDIKNTKEKYWKYISRVFVNPMKRFFFSNSDYSQEYIDLFAKPELSKDEYFDEETNTNVIERSINPYVWEDFKVKYYPLEDESLFLTQKTRNFDKITKGIAKNKKLNSKIEGGDEVPLGVWRYKFVWDYGNGEFSNPSIDVPCPDVVWSVVDDKVLKDLKMWANKPLQKTRPLCFEGQRDFHMIFRPTYPSSIDDKTVFEFFQGAQEAAVGGDRIERYGLNFGSNLLRVENQVGFAGTRAASVLNLIAKLKLKLYNGNGNIYGTWNAKTEAEYFETDPRFEQPWRYTTVFMTVYGGETEVPTKQTCLEYAFLLYKDEDTKEFHKIPVQRITDGYRIFYINVKTELVLLGDKFEINWYRREFYVEQTLNSCKFGSYPLYIPLFYSQDIPYTSMPLFTPLGFARLSLSPYNVTQQVFVKSSVSIIAPITSVYFGTGGKFWMYLVVPEGDLGLPRTMILPPQPGVLLEPFGSKIIEVDAYPLEGQRTGWGNIVYFPTTLMMGIRERTKHINGTATEIPSDVQDRLFYQGHVCIELAKENQPTVIFGASLVDAGQETLRWGKGVAFIYPLFTPASSVLYEPSVLCKMKYDGRFGFFSGDKLGIIPLDKNRKPINKEPFPSVYFNLSLPYKVDIEPPSFSGSKIDFSSCSAFVDSYFVTIKLYLEAVRFIPLEQLTNAIPSSVLFKAPRMGIKIHKNNIPMRAKRLLIFRTKASHSNDWDDSLFGLVKAVDVKIDEIEKTGYLYFFDDVSDEKLDFGETPTQYESLRTPLYSKYTTTINERVYYANVGLANWVEPAGYIKKSFLANFYDTIDDITIDGDLNTFRGGFRIIEKKKFEDGKGGFVVDQRTTIDYAFVFVNHLGQRSTLFHKTTIVLEPSTSEQRVVFYLLPSRYDLSIRCLEVLRKDKDGLYKKIGEVLPEDEGVFVDYNCPFQTGGLFGEQQLDDPRWNLYLIDSSGNSFDYTPYVKGKELENYLYPSAVLWTEPYTVDFIKEQNMVEFDSGDGQEITGIVPQMGNLIVFKENCIYRVAVQAQDPPISRVDKLATGIGCVAPKTIVVVNDMIYFLSWQGFMVFDNNYPKRIDAGAANEINEILASTPPELIRYATAGYNPHTNQIYLNIPQFSSIPESVARDKFDNTYKDYTKIENKETRFTNSWSQLSEIADDERFLFAPYRQLEYGFVMKEERLDVTHQTDNLQFFEQTRLGHIFVFDLLKQYITKYSYPTTLIDYRTPYEWMTGKLIKNQLFGFQNIRQYCIDQVGRLRSADVFTTTYNTEQLPEKLYSSNYPFYAGFYIETPYPRNYSFRILAMTQNNEWLPALNYKGRQFYESDCDDIYDGSRAYIKLNGETVTIQKFFIELAKWRYGQNIIDPTGAYGNPIYNFDIGASYVFPTIMEVPIKVFFLTHSFTFTEETKLKRIRSIEFELFTKGNFDIRYYGVGYKNEVGIWNTLNYPDEIEETRTADNDIEYDLNKYSPFKVIYKFKPVIDSEYPPGTTRYSSIPITPAQRLIVKGTGINLYRVIPDNYDGYKAKPLKFSIQFSGELKTRINSISILGRIIHPYPVNK